MIEIVSGKYSYTYILRKEDKQVRYSITHKRYFELGSMCDIDLYIKDLLEREMKKLMNYDNV
jgi:hypothetical protein